MGCPLKSNRKSVIRLVLSTIAVSIIFTFYYSSFEIVKNYISGISSDVSFTAVVRENVPEDSINISIKKIKSFNWVKKVDLIKPDSALSGTDRSIGGISQDLLPENPLPALINVSVKEEYINKLNLIKYNLILQKIDIVDSTLTRKDYADTVISIKTQFTLLSIITGIILGLIVILIIFLTLNPEFVKALSSVVLTAGLKTYNQISSEILVLVALVLSIGIAISSGIIYLFWYLIIDDLPWFAYAPWQILIWNLCFVLGVYGIVYLALYFAHKPHKKIINDELQLVNGTNFNNSTINEPTENINISTQDELVPSDVVQPENISSELPKIEDNNITENEIQTNDEKVLDDFKPIEAKDTLPSIKNTEYNLTDNWEDDIT